MKTNLLMALVALAAIIGGVTAIQAQSTDPLSTAEIDRLRAHIRKCWSPPAGLSEAMDTRVEILFDLDRFGGIAGPLLTLQSTPLSPAQVTMMRSAQSALEACAPYGFLPAEKYNSWRSIILGFSLNDMLKNGQSRP